MICIKVHQAKDLKVIQLAGDSDSIRLGVQVKLGKQKQFTKRKKFSLAPKFNSSFFEFKDDRKHEYAKIRLIVSTQQSNFLHSTANLPLAPLRQRPEARSTLMLPLSPIVERASRRLSNGEEEGEHPSHARHLSGEDSEEHISSSVSTSFDTLEQMNGGDDEEGETPEAVWGKIVIEAFYTTEEDLAVGGEEWFCGWMFCMASMESLLNLTMGGDEEGEEEARRRRRDRDRSEKVREEEEDDKRRKKKKSKKKSKKKKKKKGKDSDDDDDDNSSDEEEVDEADSEALQLFTISEELENLDYTEKDTVGEGNEMLNSEDEKEVEEEGDDDNDDENEDDDDDDDQEDDQDDEGRVEEKASKKGKTPKRRRERKRKGEKKQEQKKGPAAHLKVRTTL